MLDKKKIKLELSVFTGLIVVVIIIIVLIEQDYIPKKVGSFILIFSMISTFVIGNYLSIKYERSKIFRPKIENILYNLGFKLIEERPVTFKENLKYFDFTPRFTFFVGDIPISGFGYKIQTYRMLKVEHKYDGIFWLYVKISITLKDKTILKVKKQININDVIDKK
jgi:hypothetical protein